jgi:FKBP-type peptidyl-prolyl cis-trans isomerase FkpA
MPAFDRRALLCVALLLPPALPALAEEPPAQQAAPQPDKLEVIDHVIGTGQEVRVGAFVVAHYAGYVFDPDAPDHKGRKFVSSRDRGETLTYVYGYKRAVPGFERGIKGMKVGGTRTIIVPWKLGYDDLKYQRPDDLPPKSALVFEVELLDVVPQGAPPDPR